MKKFEKISFEQFMHDVNLEPLYNTVELPVRGTKNSAGYDIKAVGHYILNPGEVIKIPTGLKVCMEPDEVFLMFIRSSIATKHDVVLTNNVGVIDADYYNNSDNEGHFWIVLRNNSKEVFEINNGDRLCQGIFVKYGITDDDTCSTEREGGFGSTGK